MRQHDQRDSTRSINTHQYRVSILNSPKRTERTTSRAEKTRYKLNNSANTQTREIKIIKNLVDATRKKNKIMGSMQFENQ